MAEQIKLVGGLFANDIFEMTREVIFFIFQNKHFIRHFRPCNNGDICLVTFKANICYGRRNGLLVVYPCNSFAYFCKRLD